MGSNEAINSDLFQVRRQLQSCAQGIKVEPLRAAASHLLGLGKLYRPRLLIAAFQACGGDDIQRLTGAAAAVELLHTSTLIHDDLPSLDDARLRRGVTAVHREFGEATAILAGDVLLNLAFGCVLESEPAGPLVLELLRSLSHAAVCVMEGQALDVTGLEPPVAVESLVQLYELKTGALLGACCEMGALLGAGSPEQVRQLKRIGVGIGVGFQVRDDLLAVTGTEERTGKTLSADQVQGKVTTVDVMGVAGAEAFAAGVLADARQTIGELKLSQPAPLLELARLAIDRDR